MRYPLIFGILLSLLQGLHSAQWSSTSPQDGDVKYVCKGGSVTLSWKYILSSGDVLGDIQWLYDGNSQEMVAISSHGQFFPLPAFANRVQAVDNAGITVSHLTVADSGNYSVEIHVYGDSGVHTVLNRSVVVQVNDHLMTQDGHLHVTQNSDAVLDTTTDQWSIQLKCGIFTFRGDPPYQVQWIMPSGVVVNSSDYSDNHFNLLLTNPIQGGNYTCRVPPQHAADACLHGAGNVQASISVDKVDARFSLLEKENEQLKEKVQQTNSANVQVHNSLKQENEQLREELEQTNLTLSRQIHSLEQDKVDLQNRVQGLEDRTRQQIGFHATGLQSEQPPFNTPLIVNNVSYNHGNAYNGTTGYFTAPYPGVYSFVGTSGRATTGGVYHDLCVDDSVISTAYSYYTDGPDQATAHAVIHLTTGQKVWMKNDGNYHWSTVTSFSGFLISPDP